MDNESDDEDPDDRKNKLRKLMQEFKGKASSQVLMQMMMQHDA